MNKPDRIWVWQGTDPLTDIKWGAGEWYTEDVGLDGDEAPYLLATPQRELASELVGTLWQWLELAERTMEDHALRLDANRAADFCQGIRETKTVLAKLDKGE